MPITAAFDESKHARWPSGTPISPEGAGGGRFAPRDQPTSAPPRDYPEAGMHDALPESRRLDVGATLDDLDAGARTVQAVLLGHGGVNQGWEVLQGAMYDEAGYNAPANVVTPDEFDRLADDPSFLYVERGVISHVGSFATDAEHRVGRGVYGKGTYFAFARPGLSRDAGLRDIRAITADYGAFETGMMQGEKVPLDDAGGFRALVKRDDIVSGADIDAAWTAAYPLIGAGSIDGWDQQRMLDSLALYENLTDSQMRQAEAMIRIASRAQSWTGATMTDIQKVFEDRGRAAVALGYKAYYATNADGEPPYLVLLDRGAATIDGTMYRWHPGTDADVLDVDVTPIPTDYKPSRYSSVRVASVLDLSEPVTVDPEDALGAVMSLGVEPDDDAEPYDLTMLDVRGYPALFKAMQVNDYGREEMPVVEPEDAHRFVAWLKSRGIAAEKRNVDPVALSGSQNELNAHKVRSILENDDDPSSEPPIVSSDGRILDGHHRWAADALTALEEPEHTMEALVVDLRWPELFHDAWQFAKANGTSSKAFSGSVMTRERVMAAYDETKHTRWPKGTPVNPEGHGGGRFAPKDPTVPSGPVKVSEEALAEAEATAARLRLKLATEPLTEAQIAKAQKDLAYYEDKAKRIRDFLAIDPTPRMEKSRPPQRGTKPKPEPQPAPDGSPIGQRVRDMVARDPALQMISRSMIEAKLNQQVTDKMSAIRQRMLNSVEDGTWAAHAGVGATWDVSYVDRKEMERQVRAKMQGLTKADLQAALDNPDAADPMTLAYAKVVRRSLDTPGKGAAEPFPWTAPDGSTVTMSISNRDWKPLLGRSEAEIRRAYAGSPWIGSEGMKEAEVSVRQVGDVVRQEIETRQARLVAERQAVRTAAFDEIEATIRESRARRGLAYDHYYQRNLRVGDTAFDFYRTSSGEFIRGMLGHGLEDLADNDPEAYAKVTAKFAELGWTRNEGEVIRQEGIDVLRRRAAQEVLGEVRQMGGTFEGTPRTAKVKRGKPTNQLVTEAAAFFPSDWIEASNDIGAVNFKRTDGRAHYSHQGNEVTLDGTTTTSVHEITHRMERTVPGLLDLEAAFHTRRISTNPDARTVPLRKLYPGSGYGSDEVTIPDDYFSAYAGKDYLGSAYEVASMGSEAIFGWRRRAKPSNADAIQEIDQDYENFVLGIWASFYA